MPCSSIAPVVRPSSRSLRCPSALEVLHVVALAAQLLERVDPGRLAFALGCALVVLVVAQLRPAGGGEWT